MHVFCFLYLFQVLVWQLVRFKPDRLNWFLLSVADCHLKLIVCLFMLAYSKCFINFHTRFVICMKLTTQCNDVEGTEIPLNLMPEELVIPL